MFFIQNVIFKNYKISIKPKIKIPYIVFRHIITKKQQNIGAF